MPHRWNVPQKGLYTITKSVARMLRTNGYILAYAKGPCTTPLYRPPDVCRSLYNVISAFFW